MTYKMTTPIPPEITTPDSVETRLGTLRFNPYPTIGAGTTDIYFAPTAPDGKESNWLQTVPDKGWCTILRLYSPLEPWFDKTWRPGEIELID